VSAFLIDTNVFIYSVDPRDLQKRSQAREIIARLTADDRAVVSVQCLTEFFRTARWRLPEPLTPDEALAQVNHYSRTCRVLNLTTPAVLEACRASNEYQMSIWDALIWSVARLNQVPYVLTEDAEHDRALEGVHFLNPFHPTFDRAVLGRV
jgi:predicted nucleic acid-binding protein